MSLFSGVRQLACACVLAALAGTALAAEWTPIGLDGGVINRIAGDPANPNQVYALGAGGLFASADHGVTWQRREAGMSAPVDGFGVLGVDPDYAGRVYVFDVQGRLWRSDDGAVNWQLAGYQTNAIRRAFADIPGSTQSSYLVADGTLLRSDDAGATFTTVNGNIPPDLHITAIAVDRAAPARLLAGTADGRILFSTNSGTTWSVADVGSEDVGQLAFGASGMYAIVGRTVYTSENGSAWGATSVDGIALSLEPLRSGQGDVLIGTTDGVYGATAFGSTLSAHQLGLPGQPGDRSHVTALYVSNASSYALPTDALVATSGGGILAYSVASHAWESRSTGIHSATVRALAFQGAGENRLFAGLSNEMSLTGSPLWPFQALGVGPVLQGLQSEASMIRDIAIDPTTAGDARTMHLYAGGRYRGSRNAGLYKSINGGATWSRIEGGLPTSGGGAFIGTVREVALDLRSCASPPASGPCQSGPLNRVYATAAGRNDAYRVIRSDDAGSSWTDVSGNLPQMIEVDGTFELLTPMHLLLDPTDRNTLYLSTYADYYRDDDATVVQTMPSGVFRSTDGGQTWQQRSEGLPRMNGSTHTAWSVFAFAMHPRQPRRLIAGVTNYGFTEGRIYTSADGGDHWQDSSVGLVDCLPRALAIDPAAPSVIYVGGTATSGHGCVFRSENNGATWAPLHEGLPTVSVTAIARDPQDQARIVIGSMSGPWERREAPDKIFEDLDPL
ncbi:WD40/YVTN/BNR-like repeat-containing protein [Tahibacter amnicola]|uniref:BNR/Asp-box repeat protein n=1 Tax=Tahibacter amnicola TaxID=2976241 RepID=A0ABY6BG39_9GAMM|nr:hypothetical protein [Tahibacter amnicola]UXI68834.1 hypothetical protein N4264_04035 [Tahibacter amnicola]